MIEQESEPCHPTSTQLLALPRASTSSAWEDHTVVTPLERLVSKLTTLFTEWKAQHVPLLQSATTTSLPSLEATVQLDKSYSLLVIYSPSIVSSARRRNPTPAAHSFYYDDSSVILLKRNIHSPLDFIPHENHFIIVGPQPHSERLSMEMSKLIEGCAYTALCSASWALPVFVISSQQRACIYGIASSSIQLKLVPNYVWYVAHFNEYEQRKWNLPQRIHDPQLWLKLDTYLRQIFLTHRSCQATDEHLSLAYSITLKYWHGVIDERGSVGPTKAKEADHDDCIGSLSPNVVHFNIDSLFRHCSFLTTPRFLDGEEFVLTLIPRPFSSLTDTQLCRLLCMIKSIYEDCISHPHQSTESGPYSYPTLHRRAKLREYLSDNSSFFKHRAQGLSLSEEETMYNYGVEFHFEHLSRLIHQHHHETSAVHQDNGPKDFEFENMEGFWLGTSNADDKTTMGVVIKYLVQMLARLAKASTHPYEYLILISDTWRAFCLVLKYHWSSRSKIPFSSLESSTGSHHRCHSVLMAQKLNLLNYCIEHDLGSPIPNKGRNTQDISHLFERLQTLSSPEDSIFSSLSSTITSTISSTLPITLTKNLKKHLSRLSSSKSAVSPSIEFSPFVIDEMIKQEEMDMKKNSRDKTSAKPESSPEAEEEFFDTRNTSPSMGRLCILRDNEKLLNYPDQPLYVPITQQIPTLSQDLVDAKMTALAQHSDTEARMKLQCEQLYSDMQSFKAANPKGSFEDFIRWYSPRDWQSPPASSNDHGKLSIRMQEGIWPTLWSNAPALPAAEQKPLFDHIQEAERILFYFESLDIIDFCTQLIPSLFMTVYSMLAKTTKTHPGISVLESQLQSFSNMLRIFPWKELSSEDGIVLDDLLRHIYDIEQSYSLINSLLEKLPNANALIDRWLSHPSLRTAVTAQSVPEYTALKNFILASDERSCLEPTASERISKRTHLQDTVQDIAYFVNQDQQGRASCVLLYMLGTCLQ